MKPFNTRLREAVEVGSWRLEGKERESFIVTDELLEQTNRLLGLVSVCGDKISSGAWDLKDDDPSLARSVLFTYKSHPGRATLAEDNTSRYQELGMRFFRGVKVEGRDVAMTSIFHTEALDVDENAMAVTSSFELVGGRKLSDWYNRGIPGFYSWTSPLPDEAAEFHSIEDLEASLELLCPTTPQGMENILSGHFATKQAVEI